MSFDVFFQRFCDGAAAVVDAEAVRMVLLADVSEIHPSGFARLTTGDGGADLYGCDDLGSGFMANHISGVAAWEILVRAARAGSLSIIPTGCPVCVTTDASIADLPSELATDVRVIGSGAELRAVVEGSAIEGRD